MRAKMTKHVQKTYSHERALHTPDTLEVEGDKDEVFDKVFEFLSD